MWKWQCILELKVHEKCVKRCFIELSELMNMLQTIPCLELSSPGSYNVSKLHRSIIVNNPADWVLKQMSTE
jgi:hypothetical protein